MKRGHVQNSQLHSLFQHALPSLFHNLIEQSFDPISLHDLNGRLLYINPKFEQQFGWTFERLYDKAIPLHRDDGQLLHIFSIDQPTDDAVPLQASMLTANDRLLDVAVAVSHVHNEEQQLYAYLCTYRIAPALSTLSPPSSSPPSIKRPPSSSDNNYRKLVENAGLGVFMHTRDRIVYANDHMLQMFGYTEHELIGLSPDQLFTEGLWQEQNDEMEDAQTSPSAWHKKRTIRGTCKDGSRIPLLLCSVASVGPEENAFIVALLDLTFLTMPKEILQDSERRYRNLIRLLPDPILLHSDGILLYMNGAAQQILGCQQEDDLIGQPMLDLIHPDFREQARLRYEQLPREPDILEDAIMRVVRLDGETLNMQSTDVLLHIGLSRVLTVTILRDLTDKLRNEERIKKSEKLSIIGQMAAGVAHEIRNPLTSLKGFTQLIQAKSEDLRHYTEIMLTELDRINIIVNEFMVIAKPHAVAYQKEDLNKILSDVITLINTQAILSNVLIACQVDPGLPPIRCNIGQIKQVLLNLLKNAIEAMPNGGMVRILAHKVADAQTVEIKVVDQGKGIPAEQLHRLGEPFYTTKDSGTGLGLMVSYNIIEAHQGEIYFSNNDRVGTTVTIHLPID